MYEGQEDMIMRVLRRFDREGRGKRSSMAESVTDTSFIDTYRVVDFFVRLLQTFKPSEHRTNSTERFRRLLQAWNEEHPDATLDEAMLIDKRYILIGNGRAVANPEIRSRGIGDEIAHLPEVRFLLAFHKLLFEYPLFAEEHLAEVLERHNEAFGLDLTIEELRQGAEDVHNAVFLDAAHLNTALVQALKLYLGAMPYSEFQARVQHLFLLIVELRASEMWVVEAIDTLDPLKRKVLCDYGLTRLEQERDAETLTSFRVLHRLQYVPYEMTGVDIMNPAPDSLLSPYDPNRYEEHNTFEAAELWDHFYKKPDFGFYTKRLVKEVAFVLEQLLPYLPPVGVARCVGAKQSPYFRYKLAEYFMRTPSIIPVFATVDIAPVLAFALLDLNLPLGKAAMVGDVDGNRWLPEAVALLMDRLQEEDEERTLPFLQDFYMYLTKQTRLASSPVAGLAQREKEGMLNAVRKRVAQRLADSILRAPARFDAIAAVLESGSREDDFTRYDVLTLLSRERAEFRDRALDLVMGHVQEWMAREDFHSTYFRVRGFDSVFYAFDQMPSDRFSCEVLAFEWKDRIGAALPSSYTEERKARCYLGLLAKYGKCGTHQENAVAAATYVLAQAAELKQGVGDREPLSWENMISDTFTVGSDNFGDSQEDVLWKQLLQMLKHLGEQEAAAFLPQVRGMLSFSEAVMWNKLFPALDVDLEPLKPSNVEDVSLGLAEREALFLVRNGYAGEGLQYIQYLRELAKDRPHLELERDELWKAIELEGLLGEKRYETAAALEKRMKHRDLSREGLIHYLQGDFAGAAALFKHHLDGNPPTLYTLVNYAATLIMLERYDEAIAWCEPLLVEHPEAYLLHANLACAYAQTHKGRAFHHFLTALTLEPDYSPAQLGVLDSIRGILDDLLPEMLHKVRDGKEKQEVVNQLSLSIQRSALRLTDLAIPESEMKLLRVINHSIQQQLEHPYKLESMSETDLSDWITMLCRMALPSTFPWETVVMEREAPQGFAVSRSGELDFFVYAAGDRYENIATGENKEWSPQKYVNQLKQLLGYMRNEGGFGFTIIFNKSVTLETVLRRREEILETVFEMDEALMPFGRIGPVFAMELLESQFKHVLLTKHRHPEEPEAVFRMYHFVVNANRFEHKQAAQSARGQ